jgi:hypothetical protein
MKFNWEDLRVNILKVRVESVLMDPDLLAVAVIKSWRIILDITSQSLV